VIEVSERFLRACVAVILTDHPDMVKDDSGLIGISVSASAVAVANCLIATGRLIHIQEQADGGFRIRIGTRQSLNQMLEDN